MKKYLFITLMELLFVSQLFSQQRGRIQITSTNQLRKMITDNKDRYRKTENINDSTGYKYVFRQDKELRIVMMDFKDKTQQGNYIDKKVEWNFLNGDLIYSEQVWTEIKTNKIIDKQQFYFNKYNNAWYMAAWIKFDNKEVNPDSQEFKDKETQLVAYGLKLFKESK